MAEEFRLIARSELGESAVAVVDTPHGTLAVGISEGQPFAVSNRCRHLFASLGEGRVAEGGCLECPWHAARYDVRSGEMTRGPQGKLFTPVRGAVRASANVVAKLARHPVVERDGVLYLAGQR